ncbi:hypothetical protein TYRP_006773, partial [Tyrophagus putrescentiae]
RHRFLRLSSSTASSAIASTSSATPTEAN